MSFTRKFTAAVAALATVGTVMGGMAVAQIAGLQGLNFKNLLDNGRFDIYQRGTTAVTGVNTTATYHADRWAAFASAAGASITMTNITANLPTGFANAEQIQRAAANASTQLACLAQEIPTSDVIGLQGQPVVLSAWLQAAANFSAASSNLQLVVDTGTGTDEGVAKIFNGNAWTGAASTSFLQPITTTWTRYSWTTTIPATATEAAVRFCWTPVGTAGTTDAFSVTGAQFEQGTFSTPYETRPIGIETAKVQRYFYQVNEGTASTIVGWCQVPTTNVENCLVPLPVQMRAIPTLTLTAGTFKHNAAGTLATWAGLAASGSTTVDMGITSTNTATAGQITLIYGGTNGGGKLQASSDF